MISLLLALGMVVAAVGLLAIGWLVKDRVDHARKAAARDEATRIVADAERAAENLRREKLLEIRDDHLKLKTQLENDFETKRADLTRLERTIRDKERLYLQKVEALEKRGREMKVADRELRERARRIEIDRAEAARLKDEAAGRLDRVAGLSQDDALAQLKQELIEKARFEAADSIRQIRERARQQADREAREIVVQAIQRSAADHSAETTVTVVNIPGDEIKGRIIGREGRNIRAFEAATGCEVIIDDTPEAVTLSGFDPFRREVARLALEKLVADGRIHPARIEEVVHKAQDELEVKVIELGEQAALEVGVDGLHSELLRHLGILHYRTSYGQNVLKHSIEVARLAALMAAELRLDAKLAARCGLLHDIGKSIDRTTEGTHVELGMDLARRFNEPKAVLNVIASHHDDVEAGSLIACLVQAADAISGARPGARRDSLEGYIKRLETLEKIATGFSGVAKSYALQAGREIRVMVEQERTSDGDATQLAADIARRIEADLEFPGQIKVTVIREFRAVELAR
ncbi:MAG: ribonuclease Y [Calditrichaeota bacterium]|nr:ribonuclease Y [Calditrichota bacterium]